jgi:hypothetical protein
MDVYLPQCTFDLDNDFVRLVDYKKDPRELEVMESWYGVVDLIDNGAEEKFGLGTETFLREAEKKVRYMKSEMLRRYGVDANHRLWDRKMRAKY